MAAAEIHVSMLPSAAPIMPSPICHGRQACAHHHLVRLGRFGLSIGQLERGDPQANFGVNDTFNTANPNGSACRYDIANTKNVFRPQ